MNLSTTLYVCWYMCIQLFGESFHYLTTLLCSMHEFFYYATTVYVCWYMCIYLFDESFHYTSIRHMCMYVYVCSMHLFKQNVYITSLVLAYWCSNLLLCFHEPNYTKLRVVRPQLKKKYIIFLAWHSDWCYLSVSRYVYC